MVKSEKDHYEGLGNAAMNVQLYGDVAIVTGQYRERLRLKGRVVVRSGRFTDTWIKQGSEWRCIASQSTLMSP